MLNDLKLLHTYLGGLIQGVEDGSVKILALQEGRGPGLVDFDLHYERLNAAPPSCDHTFRRIASGEYECRKCGAITDELESEQWQ